jgi:sugar phosphate isomerase/epimerase
MGLGVLEKAACESRPAVKPFRLHPTFRRALSTLGCPELSLEEVLSLAAHHRLDAVELRTLEGTTNLPVLFARIGADAIHRSQRLHGTVQVLALSTSFKLVRPSETERDALLSFVPWAERMGVPWLRVFDGGEASDSSTISLAADTLRWWRRLRGEHGWNVDLMVETHDGLLTHESINRFCSEAKGAAVLWDAHNTWRGTGVDPHELWPRIAEHVVHIHVKDSISRASDRLPYTYVLPGEGEFPMRQLTVALGRDGYAKAVSLEWERQWHPHLPPIEQALNAAAACGWW